MTTFSRQGLAPAPDQRRRFERLRIVDDATEFLK
jgi:hypothetical protein